MSETSKQKVYLYGFKKQFAADVEAGRKLQTIRRRGKRQPPLPGTTLRLAEGVRTRNYRKLRDVICQRVRPIEIWQDHAFLDGAKIGDRRLLAIAKKDGFTDLQSFREFFVNTRQPVFRGDLIEWRLE